MRVDGEPLKERKGKRRTRFKSTEVFPYESDKQLPVEDYKRFGNLIQLD